MNAVGIHDGHNASVALLKNGKIVYSLSEERIVRKKNQGGMPINAIRRLLNDENLDPSEIDYVALCNIAPPRPEWMDRAKIMERYRIQCSANSLGSGRIRGLSKKLMKTLQTARYKSNKSATERIDSLTSLGFDEKRIHILDHHLCHAAAAYYSSGWSGDDILVLTNDGGGDGLCASVNVIAGGKIKRVAEVKQENSYASLYGRATFLLGMVPLEHEYKVMGMAPYGNQARARVIAEAILEYFEWPDESPLVWNKREKMPPTYLWGSLLESLFRYRRFDDISAAMQIVAEEMSLKWIERCLSVTGARRLALGGGLFMNVKLNKKILDLPGVDEMFIMPSCSDESNAIGAAYLGAVHTGATTDSLAPLRDLYLGARYSESSIQATIEEFVFSDRVDIDEPDDIEDRVATLLSQGEVVARYAGREEFGARALGNRSILSDPSQLENIVKINKMIKQRDFWMPFAASMTEEQAKKNLVNAKNHFSPYMINTFDSIERKAENFKAATHPYDGTVRPQVVKQSWNPGYHKIIRLFSEKTGRDGGVLNTSFNLHGYPIVSSPQDALNVFDRSGLRFMAIGSFLLSKRS